MRLLGKKQDLFSSDKPSEFGGFMAYYNQASPSVRNLRNRPPELPEGSFRVLARLLLLVTTVERLRADKWRPHKLAMIDSIGW